MAEATYTPQQMDQIVTDYQRMTNSHRLSQQRYYERNSQERKDYAANYYQRNKERILNRIATLKAQIANPQ